MCVWCLSVHLLCVGTRVCVCEVRLCLCVCASVCVCARVWVRLCMSDVVKERNPHLVGTYSVSSGAVCEKELG